MGRVTEVTSMGEGSGRADAAHAASGVSYDIHQPARGRECDTTNS